MRLDSTSLEALTSHEFASIASLVEYASLDRLKIWHVGFQQSDTAGLCAHEHVGFTQGESLERKSRFNPSIALLTVNCSQPPRLHAGQA